MNSKFLSLYILTALTFSSVNFLNVTYSFVKRFIQKNFYMTSTQIGAADAIKFFGNIIGLIAYIGFGSIPKNKVPYFYSLSIVLYGLSMGFIPFLSDLDWNEKWIVFVFNFFGGIFKAPSWPLLLQFVKDTIFCVNQPNNLQDNLEFQVNDKKTLIKSSEKENGKRFIVWTSLTLMGNIFGLVLSEILIYQVRLRWNLCLLIPVCCIIVFASIMSFFSSYNPSIVGLEDKITQQDQTTTNSSPKTIKMVVKCLKLLFLTKNCTFVWSLVFLLSFHSIMMMFLPLFLFKVGYHEYQGYILAWYNIWVILGTSGFTCINFDGLFRYQFLITPKNEAEIVLEEKNKDLELIEAVSIEQQLSCDRSLEAVNFLSLFLLLVACIILVTLPCPYNCEQASIMGEIDPEKLNHNYNLIWFFLVLGLVGLFLGGPMNKYESLEILEVLKKYEQILSEQGSLQKQKFQRQKVVQSSIKIGFKTFIGIVQLVSYFTVMFFLVLAGHIIQTQILGFFYLISILAGFLLILDIIKIAERQLSG